MNENIKYKFLTTIRYLGDGFFYPFFALYLKNNNLTESRVGFLLSISPLLALLLNPIYSKICNNFNKLKKILGIISILEGLIILLIGINNNFYIITVLTFFLAIFGSCHYGLMDSLLSIYSTKQNINYSSIRMFGSIAYVIATAFGGYICEYLGYNIVFSLSCFLFIVSGILYFTIHNFEFNVKKDEKTQEVYVKEFFKNKDFVLFLIYYSLIMAVIYTGKNFFPTYLETRGVGSQQYGLVYAYSVILEVITLIILNNLKKQPKLNTLIIFSGITVLIRMFLCTLNMPIPIIICFEGLRGVAFAIILHISFQYIIKLLGERQATKGIMLCTLSYSICLFIFNNVNGMIIEKTSYELYYLVLTTFSILIVIVSFIMKRGARNDYK